MREELPDQRIDGQRVCCGKGEKLTDMIKSLGIGAGFFLLMRAARA
ncbi:MAG: hypothetical protein LBS98_03490 [Coriobacteriales bacterium]|jgi:hypothetical protein|nr:hypothetical protein [Coriobacteriales bacterium]